LKYTLITGACKGIGRSLAYECASRNMNVLLISNDHDCLNQVCDDIRVTKGVESHCLFIDLMEEGAPGKVHQWVKENNFQVNMLINNVGIGKGGTFGSMNLKDIHHMMLLNNKVMVEITYHLLNELQKHNEAYILSISSLEARLPLPYKAIYTATKNFVYAFSLAIAQELKFTNIKVSVLCPGPVLTNAEGLNRINAHGSRSKILMMYPDEVARIALTGMLKGRHVIVPGFLNACFFKLGSFLPVRMKMNILERLFRVYKTS
jgi:short-subunit dehydrogenase